MKGKPKIPTSRRQVLSVIDLRQTRFCMDCILNILGYSKKQEVCITDFKMFTVPASKITCLKKSI